jgi:hypothetical protein
VQIESLTRFRCHPGSGVGAPMGVNLDSHPMGAKPTGDLPPRVQIAITRRDGGGKWMAFVGNFVEPPWVFQFLVSAFHRRSKS